MAKTEGEYTVQTADGGEVTMVIIDGKNYPKDSPEAKEALKLAGAAANKQAGPASTK